MPVEVVGDTAYELIYKEDVPLTKAQAEALAAECGALGLRFRPCRWKGNWSVVVKAAAGEYRAFAGRWSESWRAVRDRVGYRGALVAKSNTYEPGRSSYSPGPDWGAIVAFIETQYAPAAAPPPAAPPPAEKLRFECPLCSKPLSVAREHAGKRGKCPACSAAVTVPTA